MVMLPVRGWGVTLAAAVNATLPWADPVEVPRVIHAAPAVAFQVQPSADVTSMLPVNPPAGIAIEFWPTVTLHGTPAWLMVNGWVPIKMVADRLSDDELGATPNVTVPLPVLDAGPPIVTQAAFTVGVQGQVEVTVNAPVPPVEVKLADGAESA